MHPHPCAYRTWFDLSLGDDLAAWPAFLAELGRALVAVGFIDSLSTEVSPDGTVERVIARAKASFAVAPKRRKDYCHAEACDAHGGCLGEGGLLTPVQPHLSSTTPGVPSSTWMDLPIDQATPCRTRSPPPRRGDVQVPDKQASFLPCFRTSFLPS